MSSIRKDSNKEKLKGELDRLIDGFNEVFPDTGERNNAADMIGKKIDDMAKPTKEYDVDLEELDKQFKAKATTLVNSMFDFYRENEILDDKQYTKIKRDFDTSNVSNMLWQLKTVKITIGILMDEITSGNTSQKTIAALSDMQMRFSEIMRMQANYVMFLEDSYKKMNYDVSSVELDGERRPKNEIEAARKEATTSEYFLTANPKELIKQITEVSPLSDEEHAEMREAGEDCMCDGIGEKNTDPKLKEELMSEKNIPIEITDKSVNGYDSILNMI